MPSREAGEYLSSVRFKPAAASSPRLGLDRRILNGFSIPEGIKPRSAFRTVGQGALDKSTFGTTTEVDRETHRSSSEYYGSIRAIPGLSVRRPKPRPGTRQGGHPAHHLRRLTA